MGAWPFLGSAPGKAVGKHVLGTKETARGSSLFLGDRICWFFLRALAGLALLKSVPRGVAAYGTKPSAPEPPDEGTKPGGGVQGARDADLEQ